MADDLLNSYMSGPDEQGRFGIFGGRFVSETLMPLILDLQAEYDRARTDPAFAAEMDEKHRVYGERYPVDEDFLAALAHMPPASGIALGFDRLVMLATGAPRIDDVMWTPVP